MKWMWAAGLGPQAVLLLLLSFAGPARAQSPAEAQQALSVLRDDQKRAALISTLEAIAKAPTPTTAVPVAAATPAPAATTTSTPAAAAAAPPAAKPASATLTPEGVGVQVASRLTGLLSVYTAQLLSSVRSVNDLPLLWRWLSSQASDPDARSLAADALVRLLAVLAGGFLGEWLVRRVFRGVRAAVVGWAPGRVETEDGAGPATEIRRRRFEGLLSALRQVPHLFGRLVLDLLPVVAFVAVAEVLLGAGFGADREVRLVVLQVVQAYALVRVVLAAGAFLFSPDQPRLRLLGVSDWAAAFLTRWTRRIVIIGATGYAIASIGALFGMFRTAQMALLKLFALVVHGCLVVAVLQARVPVAHRLRARRTLHGTWAAVLNRLASVWHYLAIFYIAGLWLVWAVEIQNGYERLLRFCAVTLAIVVAARLLAVLILGGADRVRARLAAQGHAAIADRAGVYYPVLRGVVTAAITVGAALLLCEAWGLPILLWLTAGGLGGQVAQAITTVVLAIVVAIVVWEMANAGIAQHLQHLSGTAQLARAGRLRTLLPFLRTTLLVAIVLVVGMTVLSAIGVNIAPLLAGAGVIGIAVGFGSQKLVQDLITGLFLLLENAMQVGDVVTLAGLTGTVEALTIRTIRLRALDGAVHLIPFSAVTTVTNQTRDFAYAVLDFGVGLNEEPSRVEPVLRAVAAEMQADPAWTSLVVDKLDVLGVETLTDVAWTLRVRIKTLPASRWAVARELRRRVKDRFDSLAIESPFTSHRALNREAPAAAPDAAPVSAAEAAA